jgi:hypothetical protein
LPQAQTDCAICDSLGLDFSRFEGWFAGIERKALKLGDYSIWGCSVPGRRLSRSLWEPTSLRRIGLRAFSIMARDKVDINIIFGMLDSFGQLPENVVERTSTYT